jgi:cytidyltransferase-like protein
MKAHDKVLSFEELTRVVARLKEEGRRVVYCHGVFDLLHIGHIRYFKNSAKQGSVLVVTLTPDKFVDKGILRPAFTEEYRVEALASLDVVDYVAVNPWPTAEQSLRVLRPDVYSKGAEFKNPADDPTGKIQLELDVLREIGGEMFFSEDVVFSSSNLINRFFSGFSEEVREYLRLFRKRWSPEFVLDILDRMAALRVLVVGDAILDEYQYCTPLGKSSKDPVLAVQYQSRDIFPGGALAVANHVANFAGHVSLLSVLAEDCPHAAFVKDRLRPGIEPVLHRRPGSVTTLKRRFVDSQSLVKMFEVYEMDPAPMEASLEAALCADLERLMPTVDLVLVADFGHGTVTPAMRRLLCAKAPYLVVNTQANAGNRGFHTIDLYSRVDCVVLAEHEARLAARDLQSELRPLAQHMQTRLDCRHVVITRGRKGVSIVSLGGDFTQVPAFVKEEVDAVGSGDALLGVLSLCSYLDLPHQVMGLIGNAAGAQAVGYIGNSESVDKMRLKKFLLAQLK